MYGVLSSVELTVSKFLITKNKSIKKILKNKGLRVEPRMETTLLFRKYIVKKLGHLCKDTLFKYF